MRGLDAGDIYRIANRMWPQGQDAYGPNSRRPHGIASATADGLVQVVGRSSRAALYEPDRDLWSEQVPAVGLDKVGFFSKRWLKPCLNEDLADDALASYLGSLPEPHGAEFRAWVQLDEASAT